MPSGHASVYTSTHTDQLGLKSNPASKLVLFAPSMGWPSMYHWISLLASSSGMLKV